MKILVTGASGVIGRRVVPLLIAAHHEVTAVARTPEKRAQLARAGAVAIELDLFDPAATRRAFEGQDVVVNLATHMPSSSVAMLLPGAWRENDRIRRIGAATLVDAAISVGVGRFIQESFAPVYPDGGDGWIDETCPIHPARYNRTVADAEAAAARFMNSGRSGVVLRFAAFYGPDARHVTDLIQFVKRGFAPIPGAPTAFISSVSHDDAAAAVVAALGVPSGIYNVADDCPVRHREFVDSLADALNVPHPTLPPLWMAPLFGSVGEALTRSLRISNGKLRGASGWAPGYASVREGWRALVRGAQLTTRSVGVAGTQVKGRGAD